MKTHKLRMLPVLLLPVLLLRATASEGLQRADTEFKIFQFPADMIPRIDGSIDDWEMVPEEYVYGTDQLKDTVMGKGTNHDPEDLAEVLSGERERVGHFDKQRLFVRIQPEALEGLYQRPDVLRR